MAIKCLFLLILLPLAVGLKWGAEGILIAFLLGVFILIILISVDSRKKVDRKKSLEKMLAVRPTASRQPTILASDVTGSCLPEIRIQPTPEPVAPLRPAPFEPQFKSHDSWPDQGRSPVTIPPSLSQRVSSWLDSGTSIGKKPADSTTRPTDRSVRQSEVISATRPPLLKKLHWIPAGTLTQIHGRSIQGAIYVSDKPLGWAGEPSAICQSLAVVTNPPGAEELPYYPNYESLSPSQRGIYLNWLARGRRDQSPNDLPTGYLFLFFYGVERRVLVEKDQDPALWFEVFELLRLYGLTRKSRSIASYFGDFLHYTSYSAGAEPYASVCQTLLDIQGKRTSETALTLALANHFRRNAPIGWSVAHLIAMNLEDSRRSVVTERTGEAFRKMFQSRFEAAYPDGMILKASKRETTVKYQAGNAMLSSNHDYNRTFDMKVPGVMGIKTQFRGLAIIWNQCIEDLSGYSRAVARMSSATSVSNLDLLKTHLSMPEELRRGHPHPLAEIFKKALDSCPSSDGISFLPVSVLAGLLGIESRATLTQRQSEDVTDLVSSLGYTLSPHPGILNLPLIWSQEVAVCPTFSGEKITAELGGFIRLLYLGVLVASADGVVDETELQVFHRSSGITDEFAMIQVAATEAVLVRDTQVAAKQLQKIAKSVPAADCPSVFKLLVHIACCDDVLSSDENRMLRKIAKSLQLPESALDDLLSDESSFQTVTVMRGKSQAGGEAIPRPEQTATPAFSLDMDRIAALTAETAEVVSILSKALAEESHEETEVASVSTPSTQPIETESMPEWASTLDPRYQPALLKILAAEKDSPIDLGTIASCHHLMIDDLVDGINAWSDEALGDFLIEIRDDDQAFLSYELIPSP